MGYQPVKQGVRIINFYVKTKQHTNLQIMMDRFEKVVNSTCRSFPYPPSYQKPKLTRCRFKNIYFGADPKQLQHFIFTVRINTVSHDPDHFCNVIKSKANQLGGSIMQLPDKAGQTVIVIKKQSERTITQLHKREKVPLVGQTWHSQTLSWQYKNWLFMKVWCTINNVCLCFDKLSSDALIEVMNDLELMGWVVDDVYTRDVDCNLPNPGESAWDFGSFLNE